MITTVQTSQRGTPANPFYFNTSAHLLRITTHRASTLAELLDALRRCPDDAIFQHTFRTLQEHHFIREGFSNDFAHWVLTACNEPGLAEQLAGVDVCDFTALAEIRERFVEIIEKHLKANPVVASHPAKRMFYFCTSDIVVMPTRFIADTMQEFANDLREVSVHSIHHHFIEARLRLKLMSNDFSQWFCKEVGLESTALALNQINIYTTTLEDVRDQMVKIVEKSLA